MLIFNQELRWRLASSLTAGLFLDVGNVYARPRDMAFDDLRWSAGAGLRIHRPVAVGFDWARLLDPRSGEPGHRLHLAVGYAF